MPKYIIKYCGKEIDLIDQNSLEDAKDFVADNIDIEYTRRKKLKDSKNAYVIKDCNNQIRCVILADSEHNARKLAFEEDATISEGLDIGHYSIEEVDYI